MSYKVTVIIPTYNAENAILRTVQSLKNQTIGFENIEVIIIDDGSIDRTREMLKELDKENNNIKCFLPEGNSGTPGRGRNIGIKNSNSEYIMFLDSDDTYARNMCEIMYNTIKKNQVKIVMCNHEIINNYNFRNSTKNQPNTDYIKCSTTEKKIFTNGYMWNKIFELKFLKEHNILCIENFWGEDTYFCVKSYLNTNEIIYLENFKGYRYNVRDNGEDLSSMNNFNKERYQSLINGYYEIVNLLKKEKKQSLVNCIMSENYLIFLSLFVKMEENYKTKLRLLEEIYKFDKYAEFNSNLNEKWAQYMLNNIKNKNFKRTYIFSMILKKVLNVNLIKKIYRNNH
ncbi:MAG: glycosyltransferase family 2 protein [archaeon]|nr:glycosyltransferase family 2 protein [archaeon]